MRILITGSNGFVGPYLWRELEAHGFEVFGLGREEENKANYFQADILDAARIEEIVVKICPTHIAHLAGFSSPTLAESHADEAYKTNVFGTENILHAAAMLASPSRMLIISSAHVYGRQKYLPVTESHTLKGKGAYAKSRIAQEMLASDWCAELPINIARSFNHTGPGQLDNMFVPKVAKQMVEIKLGLRAALELGNIDIRRDLTDVRDVARAYRLLLISDLKNVIVNVCRGESILLRDVVHIMSELAGLRDVAMKTDQSAMRADDPPDVYGSHERLTALTGWQAEMSYEQMIGDVYRYWESSNSPNF